MAYSVRHITNFCYAPAVRESVMEVRMQPRTDFRQRCLSFSLDIEPRANMMVYRDFYGNTVHNFDIPERHQAIEIMAQAIVDVLPMPELDAAAVGDWDELDRHVADTDYWEMMVPSHFATPTPLLEKLAEELDLRRRANPLDLLRELNSRLYEKFDYAPNTTEVDSPIDDALQSRRGVCQDFAHIMTTLGAPAQDSLPLRERLSLSRRQIEGSLAGRRNARVGRSVSRRTRLGRRSIPPTISKAATATSASPSAATTPTSRQRAASTKAKPRAS